MAKIWLVVGAMFNLCACSTQQLYQSGQAYQYDKCQAMPEGMRNDCLNQTNMKYDEYKRESDSAK